MTKDPQCIIPLENVSVRAVYDRSRNYCFEIFMANDEPIKAAKKKHGFQD